MTDEEMMTLALRGCRWLEMGYLADALEDANKPLHAAGMRWLAANKKWPSCTYKAENGWAWQFPFEELRKKDFNYSRCVLPSEVRGLLVYTKYGDEVSAIMDAARAVGRWLDKKGIGDSEGVP